jgi:hypothetical protein
MTYRQLAGPSFRLAPFQGLFAPEKRVRLETVLGAVSSRTPTNLPAAARCLAIPIPQGVTPMEWAEWGHLRDTAFEWTTAEIIAHGLAQS